MSWNDDPATPPYEVGDCVEYIGEHTWENSQAPAVRPGDIGKVIQNIALEVKDPKRAAEWSEYGRRDPIPAMSVIEFHGSHYARKRIHRSSQYIRADCPDAEVDQAQ